LGVIEVAPFQLLCTREALAWRMEHLSRTACDALEHNDFTATALLARATIECAALVWKLMETLVDRHNLSPKAFNDTLVRIFAAQNCGQTPQRQCKSLA
jgi:hypothetical protein